MLLAHISVVFQSMPYPELYECCWSKARSSPTPADFQTHNKYSSQTLNLVFTQSGFSHKLPIPVINQKPLGGAQGCCFYCSEISTTGSFVMMRSSEGMGIASVKIMVYWGLFFFGGHSAKVSPPELIGTEEKTFKALTIYDQ